MTTWSKQVPATQSSSAARLMTAVRAVIFVQVSYRFAGSERA
jgi:hypothetical protein